MQVSMYFNLKLIILSTAIVIEHLTEYFYPLDYYLIV